MRRFSPENLSFQSVPHCTETGATDTRVLMPMTGPLRLHASALSVELPLGRALTMRVQRGGFLRLRGARVWLTLTSLGKSTSSAADLFLDEGEALAVASGQSWVVEPFASEGMAASPARLDWQPAPGWTRQWQATLDQVIWSRQERRAQNAIPQRP